ncbi:MAG: SurA N-terminal domain-containing protein [Verrucomicrobia bacterium]|nr:SurA N-terminal domain-containing protein [Verrucomicrobiota bacterium]
MIGTIRKHQTWLWAVIITAIVVSFVIYFTPTSQVGSGRMADDGDFGSLDGRPITRDEFLEAYRESRLMYLFRYGDWPDRNAERFGFDAERETRSRLLMIHKLKDLNVQVSQEAIEQWIAHSPAFRRRDEKIFSAETYQSFLQNTLPNGGVTPVDFQRYVAHEIGVQQLFAVAGLSGALIPPREAEAQYRQENEQVEALAAFFQSASFLTNVVVDPAAVALHYTNRQAEYRIPEKVQVSYVKFDATNHLTEAEAKLAADAMLTNRIEALYLQRGATSFVDTNGQVMAAAAAKEKLKEDARREVALILARKQAADFATELFDIEPRKLENIDNLAAAKGLLTSVTEPFTAAQPPRSLRVTETFSRAAFKLTPEEPFTTGIVGSNAVYVLGLKRKIPSEIPPLETIRPRVEDEYKRQKALELASEAGRAFHAKLTNALAQGKTFAAFCEEEKVTPVKLPEFSQKTYSLPGEMRVDISTLKDVANTLPAGQTSGFTSTRQGGFILHLVARKPVKDEDVKKALTDDYLKQLRQQRQYEAFSEWLRKEKELARLIEPKRPAVAE